MSDWVNYHQPFTDLPPFLCPFDPPSTQVYQRRTQEASTPPPNRLVLEELPMVMSPVDSSLHRYMQSNDDPYVPGHGRSTYSHTQMSHSSFASPVMHNGYRQPWFPMLRQRLGSPIGTSSGSSYNSTNPVASRGSRSIDFDSFSAHSSASSTYLAYDESYRNSHGSHYMQDLSGSLQDIQKNPDPAFDHAVQSSYDLQLGFKHVHNFGNSSYAGYAEEAKDDPCYETKITKIHDDDNAEQEEEDIEDYSPSGNTKTEGSDSDYLPPVRSPKRKRLDVDKEDHNQGSPSKYKRRSLVGDVQQPTRGEKAVHTQRSTPPMTMRASQPGRDFPCLLKSYGCASDFTSKNEWKRHISTQHLCLRVWRCDLCPEILTRPNDFNRKDLFAQHIKRMHSPESPNANKANGKNKSKKANSGHSCGGTVSERGLEGIFERCWIELRKPPPSLRCTFCNTTIESNETCEEWLEHVGRHLMSLAKERQPNGTLEVESGDVEISEDLLLRDWLVEQKMLESGGGHDTFVLADKEKGGRIRESISNKTSEDDDATGGRRMNYCNVMAEEMPV